MADEIKDTQQVTELPTVKSSAGEQMAPPAFDNFKKIDSTTDSATFTGQSTATGGLEGIWDTLKGEAGISDLEGAVTSAKGDLQESVQAGRATQQALRDRPESINLIRGRQQQASLMSSQEQTAMAEKANLAIDELNMAQRELETRFGFKAQEFQTIQNIMLQNPQAGIKIGDDISVATTKLGKYQEKMADDIEKQGLKDMAMSLGLKTSGSRKALRKRIGKASKSALERSNTLIDQQIKSGQMSIDKAMSSLTATQNTTYTGNPFGFFDNTPVETPQPFIGPVQPQATPVDNAFAGMGYAW